MADEEESQQEYQSSWRGKVQNRKVGMDYQPMYVLSTQRQQSAVKNYIAYDRQVDSLNRTLPADRQLYIVCGKSNIKDASLYLKQDTMSAVSLWMTTIIQAQQDSTDVPRMTAQLLDDFSRAIALSPGNAYLHYNQGNAYVNCLEFQQAVEAYTVAIRIDPHLAEAYYNRGLARLALKQQDEAVSDLSKAGELGLYTAYSLLKNQRK
jgi:tetratricopeptide (TPR) repeat protein